MLALKREVLAYVTPRMNLKDTAVKAARHRTSPCITSLRNLILKLRTADWPGGGGGGGGVVSVTPPAVVR